MISATWEFRRRFGAALLTGLLLLHADKASGQLLYWLEDGALRSHCVGSDATDVVRLPIDVGYIRSLSVSSAGLSLTAGRRDSVNQWDNIIYHGRTFGSDLRPIAITEWGGTYLTSTREPNDLAPVLYWDTEHHAEYTLLRLPPLSDVGPPVELRSVPIQYPDDSELTGYRQVAQMFADRDMLYRLLWRRHPGPHQSWLQVIGAWNALLQLEQYTWMILVNGNDLYTVEGDPQSKSVVRYADGWGLGASGEVLIDSDYFGSGGAITGIAFDQNWPPTSDLYVLHEGLISRVPRDGGTPEVLHEFDGPPQESRHELQVWHFPEVRCQFFFEDQDSDGVLTIYDDCWGTAAGVPVDLNGRPIGDLNFDCTVDLIDFAMLQLGITLAGP